MVYGCDAAWWRAERGLPNFSGLKVSYGSNGLSGQFADIRTINIAKVGRSYADDVVLDPVGTVGAGGNSGFQALNLAVQWGARRIMLVGFDMSDRGGKHWYGRNLWPMSANPDETNFKRWIAAFDRAAPQLQDLGVEVVNCSPASALTCFPKRSISDALKGWSA